MSKVDSLDLSRAQIRRPRAQREETASVALVFRLVRERQLHSACGSGPEASRSNVLILLDSMAQGGAAHRAR
jgi:hypothetical protein